MRSTIIPSLVFVLATLATSYYVEDLRPSSTFKFLASPHWDANKQELLFVDVEDGMVFRYVPETNEFYYVKLDGHVSFVVPVKNPPNHYLVGVDQEFKFMTWDGVQINPKNLISLARVDENSDTRINDGKCDPSGRRVIAGTIDETGGSDGNIYRFNSYSGLSVIEPNVGTSSGFTWSNDNSTMYCINTPIFQIDSFDYDISTGNISNSKSIYTPLNDDIQGKVHGMTIDTDGNLWVCLLQGGGILQIDSDKKTLIQKIDLSNYSSKVTSATFGGKNLDILYVTTAQFERDDGPTSGTLLAIHELGVRGVAGIPIAMT